jgi:hypothetical protein
VDLQPNIELDCVLWATGVDNGVSIVSNTIQAILTSCGVEESLPSAVDFALWCRVILRLLKAAADETYDSSWCHDLDEDVVSLPSNNIKIGCFGPLAPAATPSMLIIKRLKRITRASSGTYLTRNIIWMQQETIRFRRGQGKLESYVPLVLF